MNVVAIGVASGPSPADAVPQGAARQEARLWRSPAALAATRAMGLTDVTIRRFHLGLKEPYLARATGLVTDHALSFPIVGTTGWVASRFAYVNLLGVTSNPGHPVAWGPGPPITAFSRRPYGAASLVVVDSVVQMWVIAQALDQPGLPVVIASRSHSGGIPIEWLSERFWAGWSKVTLALAGDAGGDELARTIAARSVAPLHAIAPDDVASIYGPSGLAETPAKLRSLISEAPSWTPLPTLPTEQAQFMPMVSAPLVLDSAYARGRMYYPVTMERTCRSDGETGTMSSYVVRVLRSDGALLDAATLPHPPGTPLADRVVALSDGTRITEAPRPSAHGTWSHGSISTFVAARAEGRDPERRALAAILNDVERHVRMAVWLPDADSYAVVALFIAVGYVHRVFDALPILMLNGPAGSGKSELGVAIAALGLNGMVVGQVSGAGLIRLIDETRGVLVIDDLEAIARTPTAGISEIAQVLKCSYKQSTARKAIPGRGGKVRIYDFYGPKVVSNIGGADEVLGSRMLSVRTSPCANRPLPPDAPSFLAADLRDELHVWAMCEAVEVERAYRSLSLSSSARLAEIAAPLRALARLSCDATLEQRLERFLLGPVVLPVASPDVSTMLASAVATVIGRGAEGWMSLAQIQLELAESHKGPEVAHDTPSAETIGRLLVSIGVRSANVSVERRRLYGIVTRIYAINQTERGRKTEERDPLAFCTGIGCTACPYAKVCEATVPGLRSAKLARGGRN